jgi:hypothetical protein
LIARHQWLTPVILAIQEAEIRKITVRSQPWQIVQETLSQKKKKKKKTFTKQGLVAQGWWLKVNVLSSNLNTTKKEKEKENSPSL